jgi:hypothetical protein
VLDVLRVLLADVEGRDQILAIVGRLIARNAELEQQLAKTLFKKSEQVSTAQLLLALGALGLTGRGASPSADDDRAQPEALDAADNKLRQASGIDDPKPEDAAKTPRPPRQPRTRTVLRHNSIRMARPRVEPPHDGPDPVPGVAERDRPRDEAWCLPPPGLVDGWRRSWLRAGRECWPRCARPTQRRATRTGGGGRRAWAGR